MIKETQKDNNSDHEIKILEFLESLAVSTFEESRGLSGLAAAETDADKRKVLGHWVASIILGGESLRISFHIYFHVSKVTSMEPETLKNASEEDVISLMKEYANLIAGRLKKSLADSNIAVGTSIPFLARGYDHILLSKRKTEHQISRTWQVGNNDAGFHFKAVARLLKKDIDWPKQSTFESNNVEEASIELL